MNLLHKKRQSFRQAIRYKSIQQIFSRKRQQLLEQLKQKNQIINEDIQKQETHWVYNFPTSEDWRVFTKLANFSDLKNFLIVYLKNLTIEQQGNIFETVSQKASFSSLQKMQLISRIINRKDFSLDEEIQRNYGWKNLISQLSDIILSNNLQLRDKTGIFQNTNYSNKDEIFVEQNGQLKKLRVLVCLSLIKIWNKKPRIEYFMMFPKMYIVIQQNVSHTFGLSLIADLSYQKSLLPSYQFIKTILSFKVQILQQTRFFRVLQILKNYIYNIDLQISNVHGRQLVYEYISWMKDQISRIVKIQQVKKSEYNDKIEESQIQMHQSNHIQSVQISFETNYCLIYLLFTTLKKLILVNQKQKEGFCNKQIFKKNQQMFNQSQNNSVIKFLVNQGQQSYDQHHKNNILRTLQLFISFLEVSNINLHKEQIIFYSQLQEIQKAFHGVKLNWFETFT